jgi:hypothetical protein
MRERVAARFHIYDRVEEYDYQPCRGEIRLAAEVTVAKDKGQLVPHFAQDRARVTLLRLSR